jgi:hypothetical protein
MTSTPIDTSDRSRGRLLLLSGLCLAALGVAAFAVQLSLQRLTLPWYMPALAWLGAALIVASLWKRRTVWRGLALVAVVLLGGFEVLALFALSLPPYSGPIAVGRPFPAFEAKLADGTPFTQDDLGGDRRQALVFFRGRW